MDIMKPKRCAACQITHEPCSECGVIYHTGEWPFCPHGYPGSRGQIDPVVIFRSVSGQIRIPGSNQAKTPKGYERVEIRDIPTLAKFDREYSESLRRQSADSRALHDEAFRESQKARRSELRAAMNHMSPLERAIAQRAMDMNDAKDARRAREQSSGHQAGFEILHYDSSNRDKHRDAATGWRYKDA